MSASSRRKILPAKLLEILGMCSTDKLKLNYSLSQNRVHTQSIIIVQGEKPLLMIVVAT